jgi:hypothetical protein
MESKIETHFLPASRSGSGIREVAVTPRAKKLATLKSTGESDKVHRTHRSSSAGMSVTWRLRLGVTVVHAEAGLGIRMWIMLRDQIDYEEFCRRGQKQAVLPVRGCLKRRLVRIVTGRLIRLPASLLGREFA